MEKQFKNKLSYIGYVAIGSLGISLAVALFAIAVGLFSRLVVEAYKFF